MKRLLKPVVIGYLFLLAGMGFFAVELNNTVNKVDQSGKNQLTNRVSNVGTWCQAINENREEGLRRAKLQGTAATYKLHNLNCEQLEEETKQSSKPRAPDGPRELPIVK